MVCATRGDIVRAVAFEKCKEQKHLIESLVRRVVLLVHVASAVAAVHRPALTAAIVLLLLHAATNVLLGAVRVLRSRLSVRKRTRVTEVLGALLVGLSKLVVAPRTRVLLQAEMTQAKRENQDAELHLTAVTLRGSLC